MKNNKIKLNVFDIVIILIVVLAIVGLVLKFVYFDKNATTNKSATISFTVYNIIDENAQTVKSCTDVYSVSDNVKIGELIDTAFTITNNKIYVLSKEGDKYILADNPSGTKNISGKGSFKGVATETDFFINGTIKVSIGDSIMVLMKNSNGQASKVEITIDSIHVTE